MPETINMVQLLGFLDEDPSERVFTDSGGKENLQCHCVLLTCEDFVDAGGRARSIPSKHYVVITAEAQARFVIDKARKGDTLFVHGTISYASQIDKMTGAKLLRTRIYVNKSRGLVSLRESPEEDYDE